MTPSSPDFLDQLVNESMAHQVPVLLELETARIVTGVPEGIDNSWIAIRTPSLVGREGLESVRLVRRDEVKGAGGNLGVFLGCDTEED